MRENNGGEPIEPGAYERLFITELPTIKRVIASIARRYRLPASDAEDFASEVYLRLVADDYKVLRQFRGRASLQTFLSVVIRRMYCDYRNARWGKWRPSAASRTAGDAAVLLERLTQRDGLTFDEACATIQGRAQRPIDPAALAATFGRFRRRGRPRLVNVDELADTLRSESTADERIRTAEEGLAWSAALTELDAVCAGQSDSDRLLLKFRFGFGLPVSVIARRLHLNQKQLYRRLDRILLQLRKSLEARGMIGRDLLACVGKNFVSPSQVATFK
jgi:RNA polymerase sigma factor (sigma-70 family)